MPKIDVVRSVAALRAVVRPRKHGGARIGLVPTMGALHEGHLALVDAARRESDFVVATLFVNPKQFNQAADLDAYPRDEAADLSLLAEAGVDLVFAPPVGEMYPTGFATEVRVAGLTAHLDGPARPGHFEGVATIVTKLLTQAEPDVACFGEKDFQQLQVIRRLALDLDLPVTIIGVPTVREPDGLAMSSRNRNLSPAQRKIASALPEVLSASAKRLGARIAAAPVLSDASTRLRAAGFDRVDYVELCDEQTLHPLSEARRGSRLFAAAHLGATRLIDNWPVRA